MDKLHMTTGSGKMIGIESINTPTTTNPFCQMMSKSNTVCSSCYASRYEQFRTNLIPKFTKNLELLLSSKFKPFFINRSFVRLHSFGELHNSVHFVNFIKLALFNPDTIFTLWTKRKDIVQKYLKDNEKPANLILIYSNPIIDNGGIKKVPKYFDKVFNVFTKQGAKDSGININCGKNVCVDCRVCYSLNDVKIINELKK